MTPSANCWERIRAQTDGARGIGSFDTSKEMLRVLTNLAAKGHCSRSVQGWIHQERDRRTRCTRVMVSPGDAHDNWRHPAIKTNKLGGLEDGAVLGLMVTVDDREKKIIAYTVSLQGRQKPSRIPWYARIDLTNQPEGSGLCAHPLLHCHVGGNSDGDASEGSTEADTGGDQGEGIRESAMLKVWSPRVPLPWLYPWEALQWLLATVEPSLEPAPLTRASA